jgi:hypothetical protein
MSGVCLILANPIDHQRHSLNLDRSAQSAFRRQTSSIVASRLCRLRNHPGGRGFFGLGFDL